MTKQNTALSMYNTSNLSPRTKRGQGILSGYNQVNKCYVTLKEAPHRLAHLSYFVIYRSNNYVCTSGPYKCISVTYLYTVLK